MSVSVSLPAAPQSRAPSPAFAKLGLGALGVVYGDIGTSPLYAIKECFGGAVPFTVTPEHVLGLLSLVFWALTIVVTVKYVSLIMRADNGGEGGSLALLALVGERVRGTKIAGAVAAIGIFAAALFFGDCMLTPAISVLSAIEGLEIAAPVFGHYVVPLTLVILVVLFAVQKFGTGVVGASFGPVMLLWFATLGVLGAAQIAAHPGVLAAINPPPCTRCGSWARKAGAGSWPWPRCSSSSRGRRRFTPIWATSAASRSRPRGWRWPCRLCSSTTSARARCCWPIPTRSTTRSTAWPPPGRSCPW